MYKKVAITGVGMLTPLGKSPAEVLGRLERGESAVGKPAFDTAALACKSCASITGFEPERYVEDVKSLRLMSRDAQLAVAAASLALADANLQPGKTYPCEDIALYGSTGLTGMPAEEVSALVKHSADAGGNLDLHKFGRVTLKRVRPVLSFKILANMPICFVSIFGNIRGENGIYTPWEGHGVQAIVAGARAIEEGRAACAVVGGCDVRTHEFAFVSLQQLGALRSWVDHKEGPVPGEGAAFLVLEEEQSARARGARIYGVLRAHATCTVSRKCQMADALAGLLAQAGGAGSMVAAGDGDVPIRLAELEAIRRGGPLSADRLHPKRFMGNLYAAAAAVQVALAAAIAARTKPGKQVAANCFGHGSQQGMFLLEAI